MYGGFFAFLPQVKEFLMETVFPEQAVCRACGRIARNGALCESCRMHLRADGMVLAWEREDLEEDLPAYSLRPHTGVARRMVLRLKHSAEKCAADELADLILPVPEYISFSPDTVVTWVPMPESRRRDRCIDHGKMLAEAAADRLGLACRPLLFRRDSKEKPQASLGRDARMANLAHAYYPTEKISFPVLLIDDVLTTGTTARRCAEALREGGAQTVSVLAFTRALGSGGSSLRIGR